MVLWCCSKPSAYMMYMMFGLPAAGVCLCELVSLCCAPPPHQLLFCVQQFHKCQDEPDFHLRRRLGRMKVIWLIIRRQTREFVYLLIAKTFPLIFSQTVFGDWRVYSNCLNQQHNNDFPEFKVTSSDYVSSQPSQGQRYWIFCNMRQEKAADSHVWGAGNVKCQNSFPLIISSNSRID